MFISLFSPLRSAQFFSLTIAISYSLVSCSFRFGKVKKLYCFFRVFFCFCSKVCPLFLKFYKVIFPLVFLFSSFLFGFNMYLYLLLVFSRLFCFRFSFCFPFCGVKIFALYKLIYLSIIVICIFCISLFQYFFRVDMQNYFVVVVVVVVVFLLVVVVVIDLVVRLLISNAALSISIHTSLAVSLPA